ncbi:hypothetical protein A2U01_0056926, partial [Trifolium medium]|nr:hypothetical protein [Trifolium medium]
MTVVSPMTTKERRVSKVAEEGRKVMGIAIGV